MTEQSWKEGYFREGNSTSKVKEVEEDGKTGQFSRRCKKVMMDDIMRRRRYVYMYLYVKLGPFAVQQKVTEHCKSTMIKIKK